MKLTVVILLFFGLIEKLFSDVLIAQTFDTDFNKSLAWKIPEKNYKLLDETNWDDNPNLDLVNAVKKAVTDTARKYPNNKIVIDRIAIIQPIKVEIRRNVYFYDISINVYTNNGSKIIRTIQVAMFLNGEIINPVESP